MPNCEDRIAIPSQHTSHTSGASPTVRVSVPTDLSTPSHHLPTYLLTLHRIQSVALTSTVRLMLSSGDMHVRQLRHILDTRYIEGIHNSVLGTHKGTVSLVPCTGGCTGGCTTADRQRYQNAVEPRPLSNFLQVSYPVRSEMGCQCWYEKLITLIKLYISLKFESVRSRRR